MWRYSLNNFFVQRVRNVGNVLVGFICGIIQSKEVRLTEVAGEIPKSGQEDSHVMQLRRWLKNESVDTELYYLPYIKQI
uniref:hypothetical protein n=1 Tax=Crenothrix polyspora TaxID=360316 RepID=UPI001C4F3DB6